MKELNIIEASNMPVDTEFKVVYEDGFKFNNSNIVKLIKGLTGMKLIWKSDNEEVICGLKLINAKFIPIQQPVSFVEAITSGGLIKCDISHLIGYGLQTRNELNKYTDVSTMLQNMGNNLFPNGVSEVVQKGKWYIKED